MLNLSALLAACTGNSDAGAASNPSSSTNPSSVAADHAAADHAADANPLMDTARLKAEMNDLIGSIASGHPDTNAIKAAGSDILNTTASMLSDSGIDKLYGNSNDPSILAAKNALKKMRDTIGITPQMLDSIRKDAARLRGE